MHGIETTQKKLRAMVAELHTQGLCNIQPLNFEQWQELRDRQDYTRIAYSKGGYGIVGELFFLKSDKKFAYI